MTCAVMMLLIPFTVASSWDDKPDESRRVHDAQMKFSIIPPPGWDDKGKTEGQSMLLSRSSGVADQFSNLNVKRIDSNKQEVPPIKEIVRSIIERNRKINPTYSAFEEKEVLVNGKKAYVIFSERIENLERGKTKFKQVTYIIQANKNTVYLLVFTITDSTYVRLKTRVLESVESIRISD